MNDKQSNHFYLANLPKNPTASSEALFPQIHFSFSAFAPAIYAHSPINPTFIPNKFPNLLPYPQVSFKSLLPTLGLNSPDCTVRGLPFRTPLLLRTGSTYRWLGRCGLQPALVSSIGLEALSSPSVNSGYIWFVFGSYSNY
ncbi:hypothetical protein L3X38_031365 [Prunus dulcis]|uniref:Uncharacterized protein n=1 Tax=Prunus dulcis TaxID=3755 RepID=A0AAD4VCC5_PRUDU|nr:hypothetical protein L3X38_031365 [Prunus dulcis]